MAQVRSRADVNSRETRKTRLPREGDTPNDWTNRREVLVGSRERP